MKQPKTCFIIKLSKITDSGELRAKVRRCIELSGYKKKVSLIAHDLDYELVCYKANLDDAINLAVNLNWFVSEAFVEIMEL